MVGLNMTTFLNMELKRIKLFLEEFSKFKDIDKPEFTIQN